MKDLEKLAADRLCEDENNAKDDATSTPNHTVLSMVGLASPVWTLDMFQMVTGESCECIRRTNRRILARLVLDMMCVL